ncbi:phosphate acetyltransferase [uncultured Slackia sp.]|uniref:phosphate acetyltransferase n=1 Tax=uncultured Slackia sp. TaxID=665903 RepID=UPI0026DC3D2D|nr:phosphate acetyltransferase [uncultured Slackia sp.]
MATFLSTMIDRAKADKKTIVLPEGNDERILEAAEKALEQDLANIVIVGKPEEVAAKGFNLDGATIIDNTQGELRKEMAEAFYELRKSKGVTPEEAEAQMDDVMYFGTMLLKTGHADGLVGGACHATKDVLHPALRIIKTAPGSKLVSSFFVMEVPNCEFGDAGTFMFSDCAVCIQPNAEDLSEIAVATAKSYEKLLGAEARVAMLSHSSYGSVKDDDTQKVVEALALAKQKAPEFDIDGELQADAALVPSVAASKAPDSPVAGKANVLVFPDLDAANIGYKLVQRLAKAEAYGPITQGLGAPMNDLSRGCSAEDVLGVIAITAVQAQEA